MYSDYASIVILLLFAILLAGTVVIISALVGRNKKKTTELGPYECGVDQATLPRRPFSVKFFVVALLFLLFDVEVALLYPWAALFRKFVSDGMGKFVLIEGFVFIFVLAVALVYVFGVEALKWEE